MNKYHAHALLLLAALLALFCQIVVHLWYRYRKTIAQTYIGDRV